MDVVILILAKFLYLQQGTTLTPANKKKRSKQLIYDSIGA